ncbi:MAG: DEAD/DEAH box helicase family protein [Anaerolineales bacterium]
MKVTLFDFQDDALHNLHVRLGAARRTASIDFPQVISFSAPTGSGKTIVMTALFEDIFFGERGFELQPDAVILWISDIPELNEQTRLKIESKSDRIRVRQLMTIDSNFDAERLAGGHIYFINTQKLGADKLLTRNKGDNRQYTIWETLTNTAQAIPDRFYVVIDEAHRGMQRTARESKTAETILQKFLLGSPEDSLCPIPIVIGISATPRRFEAMLAGTSHTVYKVYVSTEEVRKSGLLKDRILIHYPEKGEQAEMTLLAEAAHRWQNLKDNWNQYCNSEGLEPIRPILVIQVEDGTETLLTRTNLPTALEAVESAIGRSLNEGEVAHTFHDSNELELGNRVVRYVEASRIEDDPKINVVLFKMSLSTGWDCPRAEVMMSFRRAQDHTYIAQLLGRMVRTPLAIHIEKDASLNDVDLFLPHFNEETVNQVVHDLRNVEDVPPATVGVSRELIILRRNAYTDAIFDAMEDLITYRVNAVRKQSALRRLMGIGRGLTHDQLDKDAQDQVTHGIVNKMAEEIQPLKASGDFAAHEKEIMGIDLKTIALHGTIIADNKPTYTIDAAVADIDRYFEQAGRTLTNALHMAYWKANSQRPAADVKMEVIILAQDHESMVALEQFALDEFNQLYERHKRDLAGLGEQRRKHYETLRLATAEPETIPWMLPPSISFRRTTKAPAFDKHLYLEENGTFHADLGSWEKDVLAEELADPSVVGWLRNVDRQSWSLEIPYRDGGTIRPMFPDLLIVRQDAKGFQFDILEPHDSSRDDNAAKAVGLAEFAEKHWDLFGRIQLIRKTKASDGKHHYFRLDVGNNATRKKVLAIKSNDELDRIFAEDAKAK